MNVGPDDFCGSDFDEGFETGWDSMVRESKQELEREWAWSHPQYVDAMRALKAEHGFVCVDMVAVLLRVWDSKKTTATTIGELALTLEDASSPAVLLGELFVMDGAKMP